MEDGGWKMEDGRWKMEDGRWKMEDGRWREEDLSSVVELQAMPPREMKWRNKSCIDCH